VKVKKHNFIRIMAINAIVDYNGREILNTLKLKYDF